MVNLGVNGYGAVILPVIGSGVTVLPVSIRPQFLTNRFYDPVLSDPFFLSGLDLSWAAEASRVFATSLKTVVNWY